MSLRVAAVLGCAIAFAAVPPPCAAQEPLPWTKGVQLGVNIANLAGDFAGVAEFNDRAAMGGGLFATIPLTSTFAVKTALLYSPRGAEAPYDLIATDGSVLGYGTVTIELNYLEAPVLARFTLVQHGAVRPVLFAGAELSVVVWSSVSASDA